MSADRDPLSDEMLKAGLYPINSPALRRATARRDICPECGGSLDTGWECLSCGYDAMDEAYPPAERKREKRWGQP